MLSFLREQSMDETPAEQNTGEANQSGEYYTVASRSTQTRKTTTLLAVLFIAGLACLGFMIKRSTPQAATASESKSEETEIEIAIARLVGVKSEMFNKMGEIVEKFYEFSDVEQVEVNELAKNPFEFELGRAGLDTSTEEVTAKPNLQAIQRQKMAKKAEGLKVLSIMQSGRGNCCMIGDKFLFEGDTVEGFTITEIKEDRVKLLWSAASNPDPDATKVNDLEITLKLSE